MVNKKSKIVQHRNKDHQNVVISALQQHNIKDGEVEWNVLQLTDIT
ncbi:MAG: hypothetical protein CM15mP12_5340 [Gammaproteobacteria bacterium]|nr:MAG: hypothetical protein CM15mP12_5340 [Gammaproteobacteria bacterium]